MGMPLHDQMELYNEILSHVDHKINCTWFGSNKAIEAGFAWQRKYGRFPNSFDWQSSGRRMFNDRDEYPCYMTISRLFGGWSAYVMAAEKSVLTSS